MEYLEDLGQQLTPYLNRFLVETDKYFVLLEEQIYHYSDDMREANRFYKFLFLNLILVGILVLFKLIPLLNPFTIYPKLVRLGFSLPMVRNKIQKDLDKMKQDFFASYPEHLRSKLNKIPYQPVQQKPGNASDLDSVKGYLSGCRYPDKKHSDFVSNLSKDFSYSNPLHFDLHPHLKQMEIEVIKMCANFLNYHSDQKQAVGGFYSGGTESILMAILAYRQYGMKKRGIKNPNMVVCNTGHAAAWKAADFFGIQIKKIAADKNYQMNISAMKRAIDSDTICVYASYPNYPYGTVDPIEKIAYICKKRNIPIHLDMCLGGYLVPFLKNKEGKPLLTIPQGVTSISLDCHKYGLSAKGASVLLFSSEKYRRQHFFVTSDWPGGIYGTSGIAGSRSGTSIASAWIAMMKIGTKGYVKNAVNIQNATKRFAQELKKQGFIVFGNPQICCVGFSHPKYSVPIIRQNMKKRQWDIPMLQKPLSLHFSFTPINCQKIDQMITDLQEVMASIKQLDEKGQLVKTVEGQEELYGACATIPNVGTKKQILNKVLDMFYDL